jgi:hypothetical protein
MKPAIRGGVILLVCLLAVFPCGAALTVLGTAVIETVRPSTVGGHLPLPFVPRWISGLWAVGGILGFLLLVSGADKLIAAQHRLPWFSLFAICLEIAAAAFFAGTYPLQGTSAILFRVISLAPAMIALALLIYHIVRCTPSPSTVD